MNIKANAKINLFLDITGKRPDGYHNIETIFQEIDLNDEIILEEKQEGFSLKCNIKELEGDDNLLKKAYDELKPYFKKEIGIEVFLKKNIPFGAGLGGGSSDCANFITGLKEMFEIDINKEDLFKIGANLGADVPFFFYGGTCIGRGIGDELEKIEDSFSFPVLIVNPGIHVSTKEAYEGCIISGSDSNLKEIIKGFEQKDLERIAENLYNGFEKSILKKYPEIQKCRDNIEKLGAIGTLMSGSGSTCFGIFKDLDQAYSAEKYFIDNRNYYVKTVETVVR